MKDRTYNPPTLAKLARGLEYGRRLVVVGGKGTDLSIDGIARRRPYTSGGPVTRIPAPRPGTLVFERRYEELVRYEAGEVVRRTVDVLGEDGPVRNALATITGDWNPGGGYTFSESAVRQLLPRMRATGAGAMLAILPATPDENELKSVGYRLLEPMLLSKRISDDKETRVDAILSDDPSDRAKAHLATDALEAAIEDIARMSAIDGAILAGPGLAIYGGGYKVPNIKISAEVVFKAHDAAMRQTTPYDRSHGSRHAAAFAFAYDHPGGLAFVVSEDGPVRCALRVGDRLVVWPVRVEGT